MPQDHQKMKMLFLCTGNSCRSQMAEGWARHLKGREIKAFVEKLPEVLKT